MSASWINKLNASDSRLHKEDVVKQALEAAILGNENSQYFLKFAKLAYNPFVTFGVRQVPETQDTVEAENPWSEFEELLVLLQRRILTGHAARDAIADMSTRFTSDEWNTFCRAVLTKDLRAGISDKTLNKILKGTVYEIPIFECQLAKNSDDHPGKMRGSMRVERKLDGVRVIAVFNNLFCTMYSRNGKVFENFKHIEQQLMDNYMKFRKTRMGPHLRSESGSHMLVLDGEVMGKSFQDLMRQARRKADARAEDSVFHVFDCMGWDDFQRGYFNMQQGRRLEMLESCREIFNGMPNVELVPGIEVDLDTAAGQDQMRRYANDSVAEGFEGIMIKHLDAPYHRGRQDSWLKWKPVITVDLEVTDVEQGTGKNAGRLGALVCAGVDGGRQITVNVGSGFSDLQRDSFWADRNLVIGQTAEVMADVITQNQDGTYSLRFPRFVRFRDDK